MIEIRNHKFLLTINEKGQLATPVSNVNSKSMRSKIMTSPFEDHILDKKGIPTGKYNTPKNLFLAPNDYTERKVSLCTRKTTLSEEVINYFISAGACPHFIYKKKWEKMKDLERFEINLKLNAEGKEFSYEII